MAGATTFHNEGYEQNNYRRNDQGNRVATLFISALNSLVVQKHEEIEQLKRKVEEFDRRFGCQDKVIEGLKQRIKELEEEVNTLKQKFTTCTEDLKGTVKKLKEIEFMNQTLARKVEVLQGDKNSLYLGEMCRKLQENVYRYVFQDKVKISSLFSYKIKNLDEDIERNKKITKEVKKEAKKRWGQLKLEANPERFQLLMEELQSLRNTSAHPEITDEMKDIVSKAAEELNEQGVFEFMAHDPSLEDVNELIRFWGKTEDYKKKT